MPHEMSDEEFIRYCETHSLTERKGFLPPQLARLHRLAGNEGVAAQWDEENPHMIVSVDLRPLCRLVRKKSEPA